MVIGDYPARDRVTNGIMPLSTEALQIFMKAAVNTSLKLSDIYFTNIMHCVSPDNEGPSTKEAKTCLQYLQTELASVKPKYVLLLGALALKTVLNKAKLTEIHGSVIESNGTTYMPTFHPGFILRDPSKMPLFEEDIRKFAGLVSGEQCQFAPELNIQVINTYEALDACLTDIRNSNAVSFDLETSGLDMYAEDAYVNCLGLGTLNAQWIIPLEFKESAWKGKYDEQAFILNTVKDALSGKKVVAQNGKFDNKYLTAIYNIRFPLTFDVMLAQHLLDENSKLSLKYLARKYFNASSYDIKDTEKTGGTDAKTLYTYCATDVYYTLKLYELFKAELLKPENIGLKKIFLEIVMPLSDALETVEANGVYVNMEKFVQVEKEYKEKQAILLVELNNLAPNINWNSPKQVAELFYNQWKLPILEKTESGAPSTGVDVLKQLEDKHPGVKKLLEYREVNKILTSFIEGWKPFIHKDSRMHPEFNIAGTVTGRLSCQHPNLQQVAKDSAIRSMITAPEGSTLVDADYSQLELRVIAMVSDDPVMNKIYTEGKIDLHTQTATIITGKTSDQITKKERSEAKPCNFGYCYGMGWRTFVQYARTNYGITFTDEQAQKIRNNFFNGYPGLLPWHERQREEVHRTGIVKNMIGRVRHLPEVHSRDKYVTAGAERMAINMPVQSLGSDICTSALIELHKMLDKNKVKITGNVHDALLFEIKNEYVDEIIPQIQQIMENPEVICKKFGIKFKVPVLVEIKKSPSGWGAE